MEPILSVKNVVKTFGKNTHALNGISADFYPGEFVAIIGPSGAGKSIFIRCLNKLVDTTEGEIIFDGTKVSGCRGKSLKEVRSKIGMVFQHYNLIGRTSVLKNVLHGHLHQLSLFQSVFGLFSDNDREEAVSLLTKVGLEEQIYRRADALSGGQKQRVGLCRALMQRPKMVLADEPIASLDPTSARIVMKHLHEISTEKKLTVLVNLHQVDVAKKYATRIIGMKAGRIVFDGTKEQLTDSVLHEIYEGNERKAEIEDNVTHFDLSTHEGQMDVSTIGGIVS